MSLRSRTLSLLIVGITLATLLAACAERPGSPSFEIAPFSSAFAYRIEWTEDGYPGRLEPDGSVFAHPLYGVYVLRDYMSQHKQRPSRRLAEAIRGVANAVLRRMETLEDGIVFRYPPKYSFGRTSKSFYSGLTQSYYATALHQVGELLDDEHIKRAGTRAFNSLLIPDDRGGVLFEDEHGTSIAEVPQEPNSYVLNGWVSALVSVSQYAAETNSARARRLVAESAEAMSELLPHYDVPQLANSRYGLTGFVYVRLRSEDSETTLRSGRLTIPGEATFAVKEMSGASRWQNQIVDGSTANLVVSRASFPEPNEIEFTVEASENSSAKLEALLGTYNPRQSEPSKHRWETLEEFSLDEGTQTIEASLPWDKLDLVAYPTDFAKRINGKSTNVYHNIHVQGLRKLASLTDRTEFQAWSDRWGDYMCRWKDLSVYDGLWASTQSGYLPVTRVCD